MESKRYLNSEPVETNGNPALIGSRQPIRYSVVIPAYNAERYLEKLAPWLASMALRRNTEVIVIDDGSTDSTAAVLNGIAGLKLLRLAANQGPAAARNAGAQAASGAVLIFFDADTLPASDALDRIETWDHQHPHEDALIGSYCAHPEAITTVSRFKNLFHRFVHQQGKTYASTFWTGCGVIRSERFRQLGGFDTVLYRRPSIEDIELGMRLVEAGGTIRLDRELVVSHRKRWALWELIKTDVWQRGVPWTHLCLRSQKMQNDLNLRWDHRLSVTLVGLAAAAMVSGVTGWVPGTAALGLVVVSLSAVCVLNRRFYAYLVDVGGPWFALKSIPLHWLYCAYCSIAFGLGILTYPWVRKRHQRSVGHVKSRYDNLLSPKNNTEG
ncbi:MAG: glycosyltransferase [Myxococcales bacterium]|nr:glycosyltransferase [Myxococcales bacterium]